MSYDWHWGVFLTRTPTDDGTFLDWLLQGLAWTLTLSFGAWVIALTLGSALGVLRTLPSRWASWPAAAYVEAFRNVPLLVQLFCWYFVLPELLPRPLGDAIKQSDPLLQQFAAALLCLGTFTAARVCEQVRAGIQSLPRGQREAGLALGLGLSQTYRYLLLPQAWRLVLPPLTSEMLNLLKNSAVASTIGLIELTRQSQQLVDYTAQPYEAFIAVTLLYLLVNLLVMLGMRALERRTRLPGSLGGH